MEIISLGDVPDVPQSGGIFLGTVDIKSLVGPEARYRFISRDIQMAIVSFPKGIRLAFHTHTHDQILFILSGKGIIADEKKEVTVTPGMIAFIPAGERHWHGAAEDSDFSHLYIFRPGKTKG